MGAVAARLRRRRQADAWLSPVVAWVGPRGAPDPAPSGATAVLPPRRLGALLLFATCTGPCPDAVLWQVARFLAEDPVRPVLALDGAPDPDRALVMRALPPGARGGQSTEFLLPLSAAGAVCPFLVMDAPPNATIHAELAVALRPRAADSLLRAEFGRDEATTCVRLELRRTTGTLLVQFGASAVREGDRNCHWRWSIVSVTAGGTESGACQVDGRLATADANRATMRVRLCGLDSNTMLSLLTPAMAL